MEITPLKKREQILPNLSQTGGRQHETFKKTLIIQPHNRVNLLRE